MITLRKLIAPRSILLITLLAYFPVSANATTKGLSQIVTPDLQKPADLSLSVQAQDRSIGNPEELQAEIGVTPWFEAAAFKGFSPSEFIFATEIGILRVEPVLLSTGFINLSTRGGSLQPYLESGYYTEHHKWMLGGVWVDSRLELILGWGYDFDAHWRAQIDYQSGEQNFSTLGFTYTLNDSFQLNPALYVSNTHEHDLAGYIVLTYTFPVWRSAIREKPGTPPAL
jgi:hypothetical protein